MEWRLIRGNIIKKRLMSFAFEKNSPHEPHLQASSSPIPRIRIWPIAPENAGNRISETLKLNIFRGNMSPDPLWATAFSGRLSEPPFVKSWIRPSKLFTTLSFQENSERRASQKKTRGVGAVLYFKSIAGTTPVNKNALDLYTNISMSPGIAETEAKRSKSYCFIFCKTSVDWKIRERK